MAWDFPTEPEPEEKLSWMRGVVRDKFIPLETLDLDIEVDCCDAGNVALTAGNPLGDALMRPARVVVGLVLVQDRRQSRDRAGARAGASAPTAAPHSR